MMSFISQCAHTVHTEKKVFFHKLNLFSQMQLRLQLSSEYPALSVRAVKWLQAYKLTFLQLLNVLYSFQPVAVEIGTI